MSLRLIPDSEFTGDSRSLEYADTFVPCSTDGSQPHIERAGSNYMMRCDRCNKTGGVADSIRGAAILWERENRP